MRSLSVLTPCLATIGTYAKPAIRAAGGLEVSLSTPANKVASASEIRVVATVKNVGDKDLNITKSGTVLDNQHPTQSFIVTGDGKEVPFTGIKVSIPTDYLSENNWVVIPIGENVTTEHDVSAVYDFSAVGPGTFTFDPVPRFRIIGLNDTIEANTARSVSITITDDVSKRGLDLEKRATSQCGDDHKRAFIGYSYLEAQFMASDASTYIRVYGGDNQLYKDYFGLNYIGDIAAKFDTIANEREPTRLISCLDTLNKCSTGRFAYPDLRTKNIYYCNDFYTLSTRDSLCKAVDNDIPNTVGGVTIAQLALVLLDTREFFSDCQSSKKVLEEFKKVNAYSYGCFAAEVYKSTKCH